MLKCLTASVEERQKTYLPRTEVNGGREKENIISDKLKVEWNTKGIG